LVLRHVHHRSARPYVSADRGQQALDQIRYAADAIQHQLTEIMRVIKQLKQP